MATESTEPANCIQPVAPRIGAQAAAEAPPPRESCALLGSRRPTELCRRGVLVRRIQIHGGSVTVAPSYNGWYMYAE